MHRIKELLTLTLYTSLITFSFKCANSTFQNSHITFVESRGVGCSKFRYKSDIKSARIQLVKLLTFNTLYCEIVL